MGDWKMSSAYKLSVPLKVDVGIAGTGVSTLAYEIFLEEKETKSA